jgi:hypothetical protein
MRPSARRDWRTLTTLGRCGAASSAVPQSTHIQPHTLALTRAHSPSHSHPPTLTHSLTHTLTLPTVTSTHLHTHTVQVPDQLLTRPHPARNARRTSAPPTLRPRLLSASGDYFGHVAPTLSANTYFLKYCRFELLRWTVTATAVFCPTLREALTRCTTTPTAGFHKLSRSPAPLPRLHPHCHSLSRSLPRSTPTVTLPLHYFSTPTPTAPPPGEDTVKWTFMVIEELCASAVVFVDVSPLSIPSLLYSSEDRVVVIDTDRYRAVLWGGVRVVYSMQPIHASHTPTAPPPHTHTLPPIPRALSVHRWVPTERTPLVSSPQYDPRRNQRVLGTPFAAGLRSDLL